MLGNGFFNRHIVVSWVKKSVREPTIKVVGYDHVPGRGDRNPVPALFFDEVFIREHFQRKPLKGGAEERPAKLPAV